MTQVRLYTASEVDALLLARTATGWDPMALRTGQSSSALDDDWTSSTLNARWTGNANWPPTAFDINTTCPRRLFIRQAVTHLNIHAICQPIPAGNFAVQTIAYVNPNPTNLSIAHLLLSDGTSGSSNVIGGGNYQAGGSSAVVHSGGFNSGITANLSGPWAAALNPLVMRIERSGSTYTMEFSPDGISGHRFTITPGFTPTHFALGVTPYSGENRSSFGAFRYSTNPATRWGAGVGTAATLPTWLTSLPDAPPAAPDVADDEFAGSAIDLVGTRTTGGATPWAWRNQGSATATEGSDALLLVAPSNAGSFAHRILEQAVSGTSWTYRTKVTSDGHVNYGAAGLVLVDSTSGGIITWGIEYTNIGIRLGVLKWSDVNTYASDIVTTAAGFTTLYLEIERSGDTLTFRYSPSGNAISYVTLGTASVSSYLPGLDKIGVFSCTQTTTAVSGLFEWFRRIA
jgi:hypothetical protein